MKRLTMKQLAKDLGLSRTTVSLVLQGKGDQYRISRETQEKIISYAENSKYRPNYFATALNSNKSKLIGAVFPDVFESFMGSIVRGIETVLYEQGYSLMISTSRFSQHREENILETMLYRGADGIILVPTMPFTHESPYRDTYIKTMVNQDVPLVLVDRYIRGFSIPCVLQQDYQLSYHAVRTLMKKGASSITCVSFALQATSIEDRLKGYNDALQEAGITPTYIFLHTQHAEANDLSTSLHQLMKHENPPDAFFVTTSGIADKLFLLLHTMGYSLPIARFGSVPYWIGEKMISIPQPHVEMGKEAGKLLLKLISGHTCKETIIRC